MATLSRAMSALAGSAAMSASMLLFDAPTSGAFWGWTMTVPSDAGFTCQEGAVIGCAAMPPACDEPGGCCASNYTCTVVPDSGSCDVTAIMLKCNECGDDSEIEMPGGLCINMGGSGHAISSYLKWSQVPTCSGGMSETTDDPGPDSRAGHDHDNDHEHGPKGSCPAVSTTDDDDASTSAENSVSAAMAMAQDCLVLSAAVFAIGAIV